MANGIADPRGIIDEGRMTWRQIMIVALCVLLNGLDGFDVLSISFAAPGISAEWGIDRAGLGIVLSMELIGMSIGSILLGIVADRFGRLPVVVASLLIMAGGMALAATASGVVQLAVIRLGTGLGIGGMLACSNAIVAEASSARFRSAAVAIMAAGYPLGAIIGGSIASSLLVDGTWRDIFWLGSGMTIAFLPLVLLILPESIDLSMRRLGPDRALAKVNAALRKLGHSVVEAVPAIELESKADRQGLFTGPMRKVTILLTVAYFFHMLAFYFVLKWIPKIVVDMGFDPSSAGGVLVWANVGGLTGSLVFSFLTTRLPLRRLMTGVFLATSAMIVVFGLAQGSLDPLRIAAAVTGFFSNAAVVGLYALIAAAYPAHLRAGGTGVVIGIGRGGAMFGPVLAGFLFASGYGLTLVAAVMAIGPLIAAMAVYGLRSAIRH